MSLSRRHSFFFAWTWQNLNDVGEKNGSALSSLYVMAFVNSKIFSRLKPLANEYGSAKGRGAAKDLSLAVIFAQKQSGWFLSKLALRGRHMSNFFIDKNSSLSKPSGMTQRRGRKKIGWPGCIVWRTRPLFLSSDKAPPNPSKASRAFKSGSSCEGFNFMALKVILALALVLG